MHSFSAGGETEHGVRRSRWRSWSNLRPWIRQGSTAGKTAGRWSQVAHRLSIHIYLYLNSSVNRNATASHTLKPNHLCVFCVLCVCLCVFCVCSVCVSVCVLCVCSVCVFCVLCVCSVYFVCVLCVCSLCVLCVFCVLCVCSVCVLCTLCVCSVCVLCVFCVCAQQGCVPIST
jgi:hypothetical protein